MPTTHPSRSAKTQDAAGGPAQARRRAYLRGAWVFVALAVLTALEFAIALALEGSVVFLFIIALVKASLIVQYYMHLRTVWSEEAHE